METIQESILWYLGAGQASRSALIEFCKKPASAVNREIDRLLDEKRIVATRIECPRLKTTVYRLPISQP